MRKNGGSRVTKILHKLASWHRISKILLPIRVPPCWALMVLPFSKKIHWQNSSRNLQHHNTHWRLWRSLVQISSLTKAIILRQSKMQVWDMNSLQMSSKRQCINNLFWKMKRKRTSIDPNHVARVNSNSKNRLFPRKRLRLHPELEAHNNLVPRRKRISKSC